MVTFRGMITSLTLTVIFLIPFGLSSAAAKHRHHHRHYNQTIQTDYNQHSPTVTTVASGRPSGCPHAYCGCGSSLRIFGRIIPALNLAANWFRFPPASPGPGMVAVRSHHVMVIEHVDGNGNAVVFDPNSGHGRTHIHTVSLRGYSIRNPHG